MFEQPLWHGFVTGLMAQTQASYATLIFRPIDGNDTVRMSAGSSALDKMQQLFIQEYGDPPLPNNQMREGRVYALQELVDSSDAWMQAFNEKVLKPAGMNSLLAVRTVEPGGAHAWLSITGENNFNAADAALLTNLVPHIRIALRSFIALEQERFRSAVNSSVFGRLNFGWLTLDTKCSILDMTSNMEQLFQRTGILRRGRYDRLMPASPAIDRELTALVKQITDGQSCPPKALHLSRDPWMDMLVAPVQKPMISGGRAPVAIAYVSGDRESQADRHEQLADLFGLLPSEARLAWELAQGTSIADSGKALGLTLETARNYSKKIYAKTGARGQAELVRIILTSVLAIA
ncbi:MAG: helix-turn-helix transcriptional regulator [Sphingobium sp.]|nr:helix-turn-helix transcriptional regulator [Sphingobium sp.]MCP5397786.1 helix-turn-helix transcriptional regulator [Sphingomonas sp.]